MVNRHAAPFGAQRGAGASPAAQSWRSQLLSAPFMFIPGFCAALTRFVKFWYMLAFEPTLFDTKRRYKWHERLCMNVGLLRSQRSKRQRSDWPSLKQKPPPGLVDWRSKRGW